MYVHLAEIANKPIWSVRKVNMKTNILQVVAAILVLFTLPACHAGDATGIVEFADLVDVVDGSWFDEGVVTQEDCPCGDLIASLPHEALDEAELAGLLLMREEEKLARDVYAVLGEIWPIPIFKNISASEQTHMDAVLQLLGKYQIMDPVSEDVPGTFSNPELQALYDEVVANGTESLAEAIRTGSRIEELDIFDLKRLIASTDNADITLVYTNLLKGSRNHLRAFGRQLSRRNVTYEPEFLSLEEYQEILASPQERGGIRL
jgi:hypothetical protein